MSENLYPCCFQGDKVFINLAQAIDTTLEQQSVKHFLGPKNQEIRNLFSQKSGGYQEFFSIKSNDFIQNYKKMAAFHHSKYEFLNM